MSKRPKKERENFILEIKRFCKGKIMEISIHWSFIDLYTPERWGDMDGSTQSQLSNDNQQKQI